MAESRMPAMDDSERPYSPANVQRKHQESFRFQPLSTDRVRLQGHAGVDLDRLLNVLDVDELEKNVNGHAMMA
jgi:hypothetical protein